MCLIHSNSCNVCFEGTKNWFRKTYVILRLTDGFRMIETSPFLFRIHRLTKKLITQIDAISEKTINEHPVCTSLIEFKRDWVLCMRAYCVVYFANCYVTRLLNARAVAVAAAAVVASNYSVSNKSDSHECASLRIKRINTRI